MSRTTARAVRGEIQAAAPALGLGCRRASCPGLVSDAQPTREGGQSALSPPRRSPGSTGKAFLLPGEALPAGQAAAAPAGEHWAARNGGAEERRSGGGAAGRPVAAGGRGRPGAGRRVPLKGPGRAAVRGAERRDSLAGRVPAQPCLVSPLPPSPPLLEDALSVSYLFTEIKRVTTENKPRRSLSVHDYTAVLDSLR